MIMLLFGFVIFCAVVAMVEQDHLDIALDEAYLEYYRAQLQVGGFICEP